MVSLAKLISPKILSPSSTSRHAYHPVDSPPASPSRPQPTCPPFLHHHRHPRRTTHLLALAFTVVTAFTTALIVYHFAFRLTFVDHFIYGSPDLPNYDEWIAHEDNLPQHNTSLPYPEGPNGRYVMFSNQQWGYGFNNNLQEVLLLSHIAYLSGRAYVFQPYTWNARAASKATLDGRHWRSATIPLSAFLAGPTAGGAFARDDPAPRSVNVKWWNKVCPPSRRTIVNVKDENAKWGVNENTQGKTILKRYSDLFREMKDPCIEVVGPVIFDFALFASPRVLSIWPSISMSPILSRFQWSPLILNAVSNNLHLFSDSEPILPAKDSLSSPPSSVLHSSLSTSALSVPISTAYPHVYDDRRSLDEPVPPAPRDPGPVVERRGRDRPKPVSSTFSSQGSNNPSSSYNVTTSPPIPGLIALHLRRGDFRVHCHWLADKSEPFEGWNQFTFLLDRFTPPESFGVLGRGRHHEKYMERCWPTTQDIVKRLSEMKRVHPHLDRVFLLTNGDKAWLNELKHALGLSVEGDIETDAGKNETDTGHKDIYWEPGEARPEGLKAKERKAVVARRSLETSPDARSVATNLGGWKSVITSKDVVLSNNEREVDQAIDMEIARRAEVFIGNGFSSLTSNIVMLRLSDSTPIENIRFW